MSGAVTSTHAELNHTDGVTSNIQTQLDAKAPTSNPTVTGVLHVNGTGAPSANGSLGGTYLQFYASGTTAYGIQVNGPQGGMEFCANQAGQGFRWYGGTINTSPTLLASLNASGGLTATGLVYGRGGGAGLGQITISTGDPSGGADGDLWFKVA